jgi:hypothetical protein
MGSKLLDEQPRVLRQRMLGSVALYRVINDDGATVTAEVLSAPGLAPGTHLRFTGPAARAMEQLELSEATDRFESAVSPFAAPAGAAH